MCLSSVPDHRVFQVHPWGGRSPDVLPFRVWVLFPRVHGPLCVDHFSRKPRARAVVFPTHGCGGLNLQSPFLCPSCHLLAEWYGGARRYAGFMLFLWRPAWRVGSHPWLMRALSSAVGVVSRSVHGNNPRPSFLYNDWFKHPWTVTRICLSMHFQIQHGDLMIP